MNLFHFRNYPISKVDINYNMIPVLLFKCPAYSRVFLGLSLSSNILKFFFWKEGFYRLLFSSKIVS